MGEQWANTHFYSDNISFHYFKITQVFFLRRMLCVSSVNQSLFIISSLSC